MAVNAADIAVALRLVDEFTNPLKIAERSIGTMTGALGKLGSAAAAPSRALSGLGDVVSGLGRIGIAGLGLKTLADGVGAVATGMVAGNAQMETYETQLATLMGSSDKAKQRLAELAKFGAETPFELPEVVRAEKVLLGFGLTGQKALDLTGKNTEQLRTIIGDVAAGTGAGFEEIALNFGKFSAGATGEAIARFQEMGIVTREQLSDMGVQFSKSGELISPLPEAMQAAVKIAQSKFGGGMATLSKTFQGQMSTLADNFNQAKNVITQPIFDVLKDSVGALNDVLGGGGFQAALQGVAEVLSKGVAGAVKVAKDAFTGLQALVTAFTTDTGAMGIVLDRVRDIFGDTVANAIEPFVQAFMDAIPEIKRFASLVTELIQDVGNVISDVLSGDMGLAFDDFREMLAGVGTDLGRIVLGWGRALVDWLVPAVRSLIAQSTGQTRNILDALSEWRHAYVQWIIDAVPEILDRALEVGFAIVDLIRDAAPLIGRAIGQWAAAYLTWITELLSVLPPQLERIAEVLIAFIGDTVPELAGALFEWAKAILSWILPTIPPLLEQLLRVVLEIDRWVVEVGLPRIVEVLSRWGVAFIAWVKPQIGPLLEELGKLALELYAWVLDQAPLVLDKLGTWAQAFIDWVAPQIPPLLEELGKILLAVLSWVVDPALPAIIEKLAEWAGAFVRWVFDAAADLPNTLPVLLEAIRDWITGAGPQVSANAADIGAAMVSGIVSGLQALPGALSSVFSKAWESAKSGFLAGFQGGTGGGATVVPTGARLPSGYDPAQVAAYIQQRAPAFGINANTAVRVAASEGLNNPVGDAGQSFGPFQLFTGGGLGNSFKAQTGLNPADYVNNWRQQVDFALNWARQNGWNPGGRRTATGATGGGFHGATVVGIGNWEGIGQAAADLTMQISSVSDALDLTIDSVNELDTGLTDLGANITPIGQVLDDLAARTGNARGTFLELGADAPPNVNAVTVAVKDLGSQNALWDQIRGNATNTGRDLQKFMADIGAPGVDMATASLQQLVSMSGLSLPQVQEQAAAAGRDLRAWLLTVGVPAADALRDSLGGTGDKAAALEAPITTVKNATRALARDGFNVSADSATQVSFVLQQLNDKMPDLIANVQAFTDKLNAIPRDIEVSINTNQAGGVSSGGGGGGAGEAQSGDRVGDTPGTFGERQALRDAGFFVDDSGVYKLARGGIITRPTLAMMGEAGPEAVVPLGRGWPGTTVNVTVAGSVVSERDLVDAIHAGLLQKQRRNGSLGLG